MSERAFPRRPGVVLPIALLLGVLALFVGWPLLESVRGAFVDIHGQLTFAYVAAVFANPIFREGFANAFAVGLASTLLAVVVGMALAVVFDRWQFPGKRWLGVLVPLPLMVPPFVGAVGIKQLFGRTGSLNALLAAAGLADSANPIDWLRDGRFVAVVALTALHLYPVIYLNVSAALTRVNVEAEEAARSLGCRGLRLFRKITLPAILPSVFGATSIVFIWALTELGVPLVCDYNRITSVQIWNGVKDVSRNPFVYALVVVVLFGTVTLYTVSRALVGRTRRVGAMRVGRPRVPRRLPAAAGVVAAAAVLLVLGIAALPNLAVVLLAFSRDWYRTVLPAAFTFDHFRAAVGHDMVVPSIANSLKYVALSTGLDLFLGTTIGWLVVRRDSRATRLLDAAAMLPLAVPGLVMAFGYLAISREGRPLAFLNPTRDPTALLVIAYAIRRLPFVVRSAAAGMSQVSTTLEEAAASLGATPARSFLRVTLPLVAPHLIAGGVFAFALSMLEVSDSMILAQRQPTYPITKAIYELFQLLGHSRELAAALGLWAMLFLISATGLARAIAGGRPRERSDKSLGGLFRL